MTIEWESPDPSHLAKAAQLTGLEFLQALLTGELPPPPIAELMGFALIEAEHGRVVFEGMPSERVYNPIGLVHGGFAMTLIDSATGCAVQSTLPRGTLYGTIETKANLVRPILHDTGLLRCAATVVHTGSRIGTAEARVTGKGGKLFAHGTSTCLVLPPS